MTKEQLQSILAEEKELYLGPGPSREKSMRQSAHPRFLIWKYLYYFRLCQYYRALREQKDGGPMQKRLAKFRFTYYNKKRNLSGARAGVEIGLDSVIGVCPDIWHGGVVINGTLGERCTLHGNNVIGNKGRGRENETPVIGAGADIGAGAVIIGGVTLAERCTVGAGAVVTRSCPIPGSVLVGVPAKAIHPDNKESSEA